MSAAMATLAATVALAGCDSGSSATGDNSAADATAALLLGTGPQGYVRNASAAGPLDLNTARIATIADPDTLGAALGRNGFDRGQSTVWQQGAQYESDIVLRFRTGAQASAVLDVEHQAMTTGLGVVATRAPSIPDSWAYTMFGSTRSGGRQVFCQGVWFAVGKDLYGITTCGPNPAGEDAALSRADLQHQKAQQQGQG